VTALIVWITEYYTGTNYRPVQSIARVGKRGVQSNKRPRRGFATPGPKGVAPIPKPADPGHS